MARNNFWQIILHIKMIVYEKKSLQDFYKIFHNYNSKFLHSFIEKVLSVLQKVDFFLYSPKKKGNKQCGDFCVVFKFTDNRPIGRLSVNLKTTQKSPHCLFPFFFGL